MFRIIYKGLLKIISSLFSSAIFFKDTKNRCVALTIDDIPTRDEDKKQSILEILDILDYFRDSLSIEITATFFITTEHCKYFSDSEKKDIDILKEIVDRGHEIGNHGVKTHRHSDLSKSKFNSEFIEAHRFLEQSINGEIKWFRPSQGFFNDIIIKILETIGKEFGYDNRIALASMIPFDTQKILDSPGFTTTYIRTIIFSGFIIVLHAGFKDQAVNTVQVLKDLLPWLHKNNYQIVSLSRLMNLK